MDRDSLLDVEVTWLLEVTFAGQTYRWSSQPIDVDTDDGPIPYDGGLDALRVEEALAVVSDAPDTRSVALDVFWPDDVAALVSAGHDLAAATGELAALPAGVAYEDRLVVVSGSVSQPEYGGADEPVSFSLVENPYDDRSSSHTPDMQINATTWSDAPSTVYGTWYPLPIGRGGQSPAYCIKASGSSGAQLADKLIIAGFPVEASEVTLGYNTGTHFGSSDGQVVTIEEDGLGRLCATVDVTGFSDEFRGAGAWYVGWYNNGGADPVDAMRSEFRGGKALVTIGELLRFCAAKSTVRVDDGRFASVGGQLPWLFFLYIDEPVSWLKWLEQRVLPHLPVALASSPAGGLFPVLWRFDAERRDAVEHLEAGPGVVRISRVRYERELGEITQSIRLNWQYGSLAQEYQKTTVMTPFPESYLDSGVDVMSDAFCVAAALKYCPAPDVPREETLDVDLCWTEATAARILAWKIRQLGASPRLVDYQVGQEYGWLELGAVLTLTDDEVSLEDVVCLLVGHARRDDGWHELQLEILDPLVSAESEDPPDATDETPGWTPPPPPPDWGDPDALYTTTVALQDLDVTEWTDDTGNGYDLDVVTGTNPVYVATAADFGGKPAIVFSSGSLSSTATFPISGDITVIAVVCKTGAAALYEYLWSFGSTGAGEPGVGIYLHRDALNADSWRAVFDADVGNPMMTDGAPHVVAVRRTGSNRDVFVDGASALADSCPTTTYTEELFVGGREGGGRTASGVEFAALAVYLDAVDDAEIARISAEAAAYYGL